MFTCFSVQKHILFQILYIIVVALCSASLKRLVFYKAPPSNKNSLLWLASWHSALWLAEHQIKSLFIVTSSQHMCLGEWNSWECAPDSAETIYI